MAFVEGTIEVVVIRVPPADALVLYQPAKVYPERDTLGRVPICVPTVLDCVVEVGDPPLPLQVIVTLFAHLAYRVRLEASR